MSWSRGLGGWLWWLLLAPRERGLKGEDAAVEGAGCGSRQRPCRVLKVHTCRWARSGGGAGGEPGGREQAGPTPGAPGAGSSAARSHSLSEARPWVGWQALLAQSSPASCVSGAASSLPGPLPGILSWRSEPHVSRGERGGFALVAASFLKGGRRDLIYALEMPGRGGGGSGGALAGGLGWSGCRPVR